MRTISQGEGSHRDFTEQGSIPLLRLSTEHFRIAQENSAIHHPAVKEEDSVVVSGADEPDLFARFHFPAKFDILEDSGEVRNRA